MDIKKTVSWAGTLLMVASLVFLGRTLYTQYVNADFSLVELLSTRRVVFGLIGVMLLECFGILLASVNYRALINNVSGVKVAWPLSLSVYTATNLYKYIPGGVMYVVGRNRLAVETEELTHPQVALSTVLEGVFIAFAALLLVAITVFDHAAEYIRQEANVPIVAIVVIISVLLIGGVAVYIFRKIISEKLKQLLENIRALSFSMIVKRFAFGLILMAFWGGTFLATLIALGQPVTFSHGVSIIGLFLLSWVAGFLTPGAPSGIGIREFVMLMFLGGILYEDILLSAMIMHRIVAASGDILAYCVAAGFQWVSKRRQTTVA